MCSFGIISFWIIYIYLNDRYVNPLGGGLKSNYLIVSLLLYFVLVFSLRRLSSRKENIFLFLSFIAAIESIWCILQFIGVLKSSNSSFTITGSWINPNITAMFLALILPYVMISILHKSAKLAKVYVILLTIIVISLLILRCRTALIGSLFGAISVLEWRYKVIRTFLSRQSYRSIIACGILVIILGGVIGAVSYYAKQDSADGRKLIWGISSKLILEKPMFGFGYGSFEKNYNLRQAKYFQGQGDDTEKANASHTQMAYNEILENAVEGGIVGGIFVFLFISSIIYAGVRYLRGLKASANSKFSKGSINTKRHDQKDEILMVSSLSGITIVFVMSLINFTITAVPIMCVFILYAAIVSNVTINTGRNISIPFIPRLTTSLLLMLTGIFFMYESINTARSEGKIKRAVDFTRAKNYDGALHFLEDVTSSNQNENYYQAYGNVLYAKNQKNLALTIYQKAELHYSSPELYQQIGNCYLANKDYSNAIENYRIAKNIQPNRFTPTYLLLRLYIEAKDRPNTLILANEISSMDEKVPSLLTETYKNFADKVLLKFKEK